MQTKHDSQSASLTVDSLPEQILLCLSPAGFESPASVGTATAAGAPARCLPIAHVHLAIESIDVVVCQRVDFVRNETSVFPCVVIPRALSLEALGGPRFFRFRVHVELPGLLPFDSAVLENEHARTTLGTQTHTHRHTQTQKVHLFCPTVSPPLGSTMRCSPVSELIQCGRPVLRDVRFCHVAARAGSSEENL